MQYVDFILTLRETKTNFDFNNLQQSTKC